MRNRTGVKRKRIRGGEWREKIKADTIKKRRLIGESGEKIEEEGRR